MKIRNDVPQTYRSSITGEREGCLNLPIISEWTQIDLGVTRNKSVMEDDHDEIEVISSQIVYSEDLPANNINNEKKPLNIDKEEVKRKRITRVVAGVAIVLILTCLALVGITMRLSDSIDEKGE